jgi:hypothetical protein
MLEWPVGWNGRKYGRSGSGNDLLAALPPPCGRAGIGHHDRVRVFIRPERADPDPAPRGALETADALLPAHALRLGQELPDVVNGRTGHASTVGAAAASEGRSMIHCSQILNLGGHAA